MFKRVFCLFLVVLFAADFISAVEDSSVVTAVTRTADQMDQRAGSPVAGILEQLRSLSQQVMKNVGMQQ